MYLNLLSTPCTLVNHKSCILSLSLPECLIEFCKVTLPFESVDEILWCDHSNESSLSVLSHDAICLSNFTKWNSEIWSKFAFGHFWQWKGYLTIYIIPKQWRVRRCILIFLRLLSALVLHLSIQLFEKGRKMCTRQSRKVLWVVLSVLFFKEIWKNDLRKATKVGSTATGVRNCVLIVSHITFRDCREHIFFRQAFSK